PDLFGCERRLELLASTLALECPVTETEALQLPNYQGVEIGPVAKVTKEGVRSTAEPAGTQADLNIGNEGPPFFLPQPSQRGLDERLVRGQFRTTGQTLCDQVRKGRLRIHQADRDGLSFERKEAGTGLQAQKPDQFRGGILHRFLGLELLAA